MIPSIFKIPIFVVLLALMLLTPGDISTERKIAELHEQIAVIQVKMDNMQEATVLQAKEYERRLELLNGESGRTIKDKELYQMKTDALTSENELKTLIAGNEKTRIASEKEISEKIQILNDLSNKAQGGQAVMSTAISIGVMLAGFIGKYFLDRPRVRERISK